jgi:hypothetical protein
MPLMASSLCIARYWRCSVIAAGDLDASIVCVVFRASCLACWVLLHGRLCECVKLFGYRLGEAGWWGGKVKGGELRVVPEAVDGGFKYTIDEYEGGVASYTPLLLSYFPLGSRGRRWRFWILDKSTRSDSRLQAKMKGGAAAENVIMTVTKRSQPSSKGKRGDEVSSKASKLHKMPRMWR